MIADDELARMRRDAETVILARKKTKTGNYETFLDFSLCFRSHAPEADVLTLLDELAETKRRLATTEARLSGAPDEWGESWR